MCDPMDGGYSEQPPMSVAPPSPAACMTANGHYAEDAPKKKPRKKVEKGHGRNGVVAYTGARREKVPLETIKTGDPCPNPEEDCHGSLYRYFEPRSVLRLEGVAPSDPMEIVHRMEIKVNDTLAAFSDTSREWQKVAQTVNRIAETKAGYL